MKKLSKLKQTDGQVETLDDPNAPKQSATQPKTLAQFFGETIQGKYHTTNEEEYQDFLKTLNKTDLQRHAIKCGLLPKDDRNRLVVALIKEFKRVVASYKPLPVINPKPKKPMSKELVNFLAGGR